jgi:hypothetical protein
LQQQQKQQQRQTLHHHWEKAYTDRNKRHMKPQQQQEQHEQIQWQMNSYLEATKFSAILPSSGLVFDKVHPSREIDWQHWSPLLERFKLQQRLNRQQEQLQQEQKQQ